MPHSPGPSRQSALERIRESPHAARLLADDVHTQGLLAIRTIRRQVERIEALDFDTAQIEMDLLVSRVRDLLLLEKLVIDIGWLPTDGSLTDMPDHSDVRARAKTVRNILAHQDDYLLRIGRVRQEIDRPFSRFFERGSRGTVMWFCNPWIQVGSAELGELAESVWEALARVCEGAMAVALPTSSQIGLGRSTQFTPGESFPSQRALEPGHCFVLRPQEEPIELDSRGLWVATSDGPVDVLSLQTIESILGTGLHDGRLLDIEIAGHDCIHWSLFGEWMLFTLDNGPEILHHREWYPDMESLVLEALELSLPWGYETAPLHEHGVCVELRSPYLDPANQVLTESLLDLLSRGEHVVKVNGTIVRPGLPD